jgi:opacity protein-like surface antigen
MLALVLAFIPACATQTLTTKPHRSEVELAGGWNQITNAGGDADMGYVGEITYGFMLNQWAEFGGMFAVSHEEADQDQQATSGRFHLDQGVKITDYVWGPVFRANLPTNGPLVPFGEAAIGFGTANVSGHVSTNSVSVDVESSEYVVSYQLGVGARWFVTDDLALLALGRYRWLDISGVSGTIDTVQFLVGLTFTF